MSDGKQKSKPKEKIVRLGPDRLTIKETEVIIDAKHRMPDWEVRDLNPLPVYIEENKYYLIEVRKGDPGFAARYLLYPWPADLTSNAKNFHTYDADAVAERDSSRRSGQMDEVIHASLMPFYGVLGLLWSGVQ